MTSNESGVDAEFLARLRALIGKPVASAASTSGPDPVNLPMIRHWTAAFEDANPVYVDADAAGSSRHGQIVAPPLMLQTWTMPTPIITGIGERGGSPTVLDGESPLSVFDNAGFTGTLATNSEFEFVRYLHLGETVSASTVFETISDPKQTRLGEGFFVTWSTTYRDQTGEIVGTQRFSVLKFRPPQVES